MFSLRCTCRCRKQLGLVHEPEGTDGGRLGEMRFQRCHPAAFHPSTEIASKSRAANSFPAAVRIDARRSDFAFSVTARVLLERKRFCFTRLFPSGTNRRRLTCWSGEMPHPQSCHARCGVDLSCCVRLLIRPFATLVTMDRGENRMDQT